MDPCNPLDVSTGANYMGYDIRLERQGVQPIAVVRRRASKLQLPRVVPEACGVVWAVLRSRNLPGLGRNLAVYLDDQINLEVGVEIRMDVYYQLS